MTLSLRTRGAPAAPGGYPPGLEPPGLEPPGLEPPGLEPPGLEPPGRVPGRLLRVYGVLLGPLLAGYLLFDKAFAYIRLPGTPLYIGEMFLVLGTLAILGATGYLRLPLSEEPVLAVLAVFFAWGLIRFLPGYRAYGVVAVRDFALVYYCLFAFLAVAAMARSPDLMDRWIARLARFVPFLLPWLVAALILQSAVKHAPNVPGSTVSVLTHGPGNCAIAALIALGSLWLFPGTHTARGRALWSILALVVLALSATQNRGGLVGAAAGIAVGLAFFRPAARLRLIARAVVVTVAGLALAATLSLQLSTGGGQGRAFSASQLITSVTSIGNSQESTSLGGTVAGRETLWTLIYRKQVADGRLLDGYGFGLNLAYAVGDTEVTNGPDPLRSPHNSHFDVLARTGLLGLSLWVAIWLGWYWRLIMGCRRLARRGQHTRRQVAVLCLAVNTAILVSAFFAPPLEGAQVAVVLWTAFGVGVTVTSTRPWAGGLPDTVPG